MLINQLNFLSWHNLRGAGIATDIYPSPSKMNKMMKYANAISAPYVIVLGESERKTGTFRLKNMETGDQVELDKAGLIQKFS